MNREAKLKKLEQALVLRLLAAGHKVERPACYQEARYDADGHLMPLTAEKLRQTAETRTAQKQEADALFLERYQRPTFAWPNGKGKMINERVARATGTLPADVLKQLKAFKLDWENADTTSLPIEFQVSLFIAGLMNNPPSEVTRAALAVFHPLGLFSLLSIDPPVFEARRRTQTIEPKIEERQLREYEALIPVLREYGGRVIDAHILETVLTKLQQLLSARVVVSLSQSERECREARRHRDMSAVRETGWTTSAVEYRRSKLTKLAEGLRAAEPKQWPISRVAALLLASEGDWSLSPSPKFLAKYRDRQDALEDLLKKDLARVEAKSSAKTPAHEPKRASAPRRK